MFHLTNPFSRMKMSLEKNLFSNDYHQNQIQKHSMRIKKERDFTHTQSATLPTFKT